jgi:hypothetical protein
MSEYFVGTTGANSQTNFESLTTSQVLDDLSLNTGDSPTFSGLFINSTGTSANNTLFSVDGSNGRLFGVTDDVTGSIFSVNDAAGLPIIEVESTSSYDKITMGEYGSDLLVLSGQSTVEITGSQIASESWVGQQGYLTSTTAVNDATITIQGGTNITTSIGDFTTNQASAETLTINHATISRSDTTSSSTIAFGGTLSAINSITSSNGHVTAENTVSYTLPSLGTTSTTALAGNTTVNDVSETNLLNKLAALDSSDTIYIGDAGDDTTVVVRGTLQVDGSTTTINSNTLSIGDNQIVLNNDVTGTPTQNAGIAVQRGTATSASLIWDEANDYWKAGKTGSEVQLALTNGTYSGLRAQSTTKGDVGLGNVANTLITVTSSSVSDGTNTFNKATLASLGTDAFNDAGTYANLRAQATTKGDVGLGNVTNESKATMFSSPSFTGDVVITDDTFPFIRSSTNGLGAGIKFSDHTTGYTQNGTLTFLHGNGSSYGSDASFTLSTSEASTTILADGKLMYGEGIYSKPATGTGAGTRKDSNWDTAYGWGDHASAGYSIKASDETISGAKTFGNITSSAGYKANIAESSDADNITSNNIKYGYLANAASNKPVTGNSQYASVGNITLTHYDAAAVDDFYIRAKAYNGNTSWAKIFTDQNSAFAPLASPALTGNPTAPTPSTSDSDTSIATTAFVKAQNYLSSETYSTASALLTAIKTVDGSGSGLDADTLDGVSSGSFLRSDANDTVTGEITGSGDPSLSGFFLPQNPEGRHVKAPWFFNDMAYARLKGATVSVTVTGGSSPGTTDIDAMFDAATGFWNLATSGVTEVVIEITNPPKTMYHGSHMGATFGNTTWRPKDIKLESYYNGQYNELLDVSNQSKEYVTTSYNSGGNAQSKLRWTFSNFNSTSMRIVSLFAYNYNATGMPSLYLANNGGELYGDVTLKSPTGASQSSYALKLRKTNSSSAAQDGAEIVSGPYSTNTNGGDLILKTSNTSAVLTERMRINGAGNVGIGTDSPSNTLDISGGLEVNAEAYIRSTNNVGLRIQTTDQGTTGTDGLRVGLNATHAFVWQYENLPLAFATNGSQKATILANGNFGIGNAAPSYKLDVNGDFRVVNAATFSAATYFDQYLYHAGDTDTFIRFQTNDVNLTAAGQNMLRVDGNSTQKTVVVNEVGIDADFRVESSGEANALFVKGSDGNVGIGTVSPYSKLHVVGDTPIIQIRETSGAAEAGISINHAVSGNHVNFFIGTLDGNARKLTIGGTITDGHSTNTAQAAASLMLIDEQTGNVGIGTTSPSVKLEIQTATNTSSAEEGLRLYNAGGGIGAGVRIGLGVGATYDEKGHIRTDIVSGGAGRLFLGSNGSDRLVINENGKVLVNGADDNSGKADFAASGGTVIAFRNSQVQMGGTDMNWNSKIFDDGEARWAAWDRNIEIFSTGSNTGSATARDIIFSPQTSGSAASTERMRIKGDGTVGIGTSSPSGEFHVSNTSDFFTDLDGDDSAIIFKEAGGNPWRIGNKSSDNSFRITQDVGSLNTNPRFTIANGGNVGIGVTDPDSKLEIKGSGTGGGSALKVKNSNDSELLTVADNGIVVVPNNYFYVSSSAGAYFNGNLRARGGISTDQGTLSITGDVNFDSNTMFVDSTNNRVGIGTTSAEYELHVIGTASFTDTVAGAYFEENASNPELKELDTGTILTMDEEGEIVPSCKANDTMVFGASKRGYKQPIVMGAEPIKMTGPIKVGDFITTSSRYGHGMRSETKEVGTIIAQAMESGDGDSYNIKAMIRKM